jgi:hypothetical protein
MIRRFPSTAFFFGNSLSVEAYLSNLVLVGGLEHIDIYMIRLERIFGADLGKVSALNASDYKGEVPDRRAEIRSKFPFDLTDTSTA